MKRRGGARGDKQWVDPGEGRLIVKWSQVGQGKVKIVTVAGRLEMQIITFCIWWNLIGKVGAAWNHIYWVKWADGNSVRSVDDRQKEWAGGAQRN